MNERSGDGFLGGRVRLRQPAGGFRSGIDAVMLAATIPALEGDEVLEMGSGAGVASLCLAARVPGCRVCGVEIDPDLVALANANARDNGMEQRVHFLEADALAPPKVLRTSFAHVFCNPPFHGREGQVSPQRARALALRDEGRLGEWLMAGQKRVRANGSLTAIIRADRLGDALSALPARGLSLFPLWPRAGEEAKRVIVRLRKSSRAPLALLPGIVLHHKNGHYTAEAEEILRSGASLALEEPPL